MTEAGRDLQGQSPEEGSRQKRYVCKQIRARGLCRTCLPFISMYVWESLWSYARQMVWYFVAKNNGGNSGLFGITKVYASLPALLRAYWLIMNIHSDPWKELYIWTILLVVNL